MQNTGHEQGRIHVAVGVVKNPRQQILIARRPAEKSHGGCWEFPGGKVGREETVTAALHRELLEELNLDTVAFRPLIAVDHDYPDYSVRLHVYLVYKWRGDVHGREGQLLRWVEIDRLDRYRYPRANRHILSALQLPELYLVTPEPEIRSPGFLAACEDILHGGCRMIQFRCKTVAFEKVRPVFNQLRDLCDRFNARLLLNSTMQQAVEAGAHGCHLSVNNLMQHRDNKLPEDFLLGASCHDRRQLELARECNADFVVVGPVKPTPTHPRAQELGWAGLGELVAATNLPVYAIGGMQPADLENCWQHGAHGLAAITGIWNSGSEIVRATGVTEQLISAW